MMFSKKGRLAFIGRTRCKEEFSILITNKNVICVIFAQNLDIFQLKQHQLPDTQISLVSLKHVLPMIFFLFTFTIHHKKRYRTRAESDLM